MKIIHLNFPIPDIHKKENSFSAIGYMNLAEYCGPPIPKKLSGTQIEFFIEVNSKFMGTPTTKRVFGKTFFTNEIVLRKEHFSNLLKYAYIKYHSLLFLASLHSAKGDKTDFEVSYLQSVNKISPLLVGGHVLSAEDLSEDKTTCKFRLPLNILDCQFFNFTFDCRLNPYSRNKEFSVEIIFGISKKISPLPLKIMSLVKSKNKRGQLMQKIYQLKTKN